MGRVCGEVRSSVQRVLARGVKWLEGLTGMCTKGIQHHHTECYARSDG